MTSAEGTHLVVLSWKNQAVRVSEGKRARIGRHSANDIVLDFPAASRFHAEVRWNDGWPVVVDCCSHNGTFLNGTAISGPAILKDGAQISVADCKIRVRVENTNAPALLPDGEDPEVAEVTLFETDAARAGAFSSSRELHSFLLDLEAEAETGTVEVEAADGRRRSLHLAAGRVAAASCGGLDGLDALEKVVRVESGQFAFRQRFEPVDGTIDVSIESYLKAGYWATLAVTKRWQPAKSERLSRQREETPPPASAGDEAEAGLDGWLQGETDLHDLLHRVERETRSGSLWLRLGAESFVLTLSEGQVQALHRNARPVELCLREVAQAARQGGKFLFACDPLVETEAAGVAPRDLLRALLS